MLNLRGPAGEIRPQPILRFLKIHCCRAVCTRPSLPTQAMLQLSCLTFGETAESRFGVKLLPWLLAVVSLFVNINPTCEIFHSMQSMLGVSLLWPVGTVGKWTRFLPATLAR